MTTTPESHPLEYATSMEPGSRGIGRSLILVTAGRTALLGLWFIGGLLLARHLEPSEFGLYTLCLYAIRIVTGCLGDPLDRAVMREAPLYWTIDRPQALAVFRAAFWFRISIGVIAIAFAALAPNASSWLIFGRSGFRMLALLSGVGILGDLLLRSVFGFFQVAGRFGSFMIVDTVWQLGRLLAIIGLIGAAALSVNTAVGSYAAVPFVAFAIGAAMLPRDLLKPLAPPRQHLSDIFHYSKWMALAMAAAAVYERLDVILVGHFRGEHDLGVYAGAMFLAVIPDFLNSAVQTVLTPKVAPAFHAGQFGALNRAYLRYALPLGLIALVIAGVFGGWVIRALLTAKYVEAIVPFKILLAGTTFNVVFTPLPSALLSFIAPRKVLVVTLSGLVMVGIGGAIVIPRIGVIGAAVLILATRIVIGVVINLMTIQIMRNAGAQV